MMLPFDGTGGNQNNMNMSRQISGQGNQMMMQQQQQNMQFQMHQNNTFQRQSSFNGFPNMQMPQMQQHTMPQHMQMSGNAQLPNMGNGMGNMNMNNIGNMQSSNSRQHQRSFSASGIKGNWQSDKDIPHRRQMIQEIVKILKKDKNGNADWLSKLPNMAKQLEVSLYRNARSFEEYTNMSTLKHRLQLIAREVSHKAKPVTDQPPVGQGNNNFNNNGMMNQQNDLMRNAYGNNMNMNPMNNMGSMNNMGNMNNQQMMGMMQPQRQVNMDQINPMANRPTDMLRSTSGTHNSNVVGGGGGGSSSMNPSRNPMQSNGGSSSTNHSSSNQTRNDPEWKIRIRHKQQRLLLLHHSAKCTADPGTCQVTPHCADMKRLWRHMERCKDNNCRVPHCFSSRAILSHYRKCKDVNCPACGPVRDTVRKAQTKSSSRRSINNQATPQQVGMGLNSMSNTFGGMPNMNPNSMMSASPDPIAPGMGFNSQTNAFQQQRQTSQSAMPPPMNQGMNSFNPMSAMNQPSNNSLRQSGQGASNTQGMGNIQQNMFQNGAQPKNDLAVPLPRGTSGNNQRTSSSSQPAAGSGSGGRGGRENSEWQRIRHKQQRLLLLRHASKCQFEAGKCPVTPHCASMKKLWEHIALCKDQQCQVQHCMSSRYVLSHYRRCKDSKCPACGPVRESIKKSHEKDKKKSPTNGTNVMANDVPSLDIGGPSSMAMSVPSSSQNKGGLDAQPRVKKMKTETGSVSTGANSHPITHQSTTSPSSSVVTPVVNNQSSSVQNPSNVPDASPSTVASKSQPTPKSKSADYSLINSFSIKEIETHLASLHRAVQLPPTKIKAKCGELLRGLQSHTHGWVFNTPVDPEELGLPDYFQIIKKPMDLGTIGKKLEGGAYHSIEEFASDVHLTFDNAMRYNEDGSVVHGMAKELKVKFQEDHEKFLAALEQEDRDARKNDRACTLCGSEKLLFEPPVFFCNGMNCASQRIRRNSHFYIGGNNQYFWCNQCYNELDGTIPIELVETTIMKGDLKKKKNDEVHEESWVQCDVCDGWTHQICGLFNARQNKEQHSKYFCPKCLLNKRKNESMAQLPKPPVAADLPRTKLSEYLERHVSKKVMERKSRMVSEKVQNEKISMEEAMKRLKEGGPITIRQVTATDRKLEVRELMKKRYEHKNYPDEYPFRCKCLVVFQRIDGVDVILFALYVYEHGEDNPAPNKRAVYISYLDSVHYMRPRKLRTFVYHELLISYLDYARRKGFSTAHIWACPPLKGDDYIFFAKPDDQKTPRDGRLRQWYIDMLNECQKRNICGKVTNMYDLYFANEKLDATSVPYMEGDYFPGEAENIIKEINEGGGKKSSSGKGKKKKSSKVKSRGGTRSDDECELSEGIGDPKKSYKEGGRDEVMVKMGETIHPMKESFIVAFLNWSGARSEDMVVPQYVEEHRQQARANGTLVDEDLNSNKKRNIGGDLKDKQGRPIKVIDDDDEDMDCEFLNNRQAFLNLCRGNHYQFDELRRAKHTSMMILWHLHNRDAPKFVQQCAACNKEILTGFRYHCNTCPDYDLCEDCNRNRNSAVNRGTCTHQLQKVAVENDNNQGGDDNGTNGLTEAQRRERQRNLQLHIQLIEHASRCVSPTCTSSNCLKMKSYLKHGKTCKQKASGGCKICKRIWTLLRIHAQKCKESVCPIPQCMAIRERIRQLAKQQQAMDDRRRQAMNGAYRMSVTSGSG